MIRKTIFWTHLVCGVAAGFVILMMSVTGVLLTYERQIMAFADRALYEEAAPDAAPRPIAALLTAVMLYDPAFEASSVTLARDAAAPVSVGAGRRGSLYMNRYTGEVLGPGATGLAAFFDIVTGWHRWFNVSGEGRAAARFVTGLSNTLFLLLICSGLYLWLPRVYKWAAFRTRLLFNAKAASAKARDFNWHHVFGIWSAIPLLIVVASAVVFSYGWANDLVYRSFGEEPPARGRRRVPGDVVRVAEVSNAPRMSLDALLERASRQVEMWNRITLQLPAADAAAVSFSIDQGNGGQPQHRHTLTLDAYSGEVLAWQPFDSQSPGRQARTLIRFLHTGEALGIVGQTIAGLVSLTSVFMVWTGLALAFRRLIVPLFARGR